MQMVQKGTLCIYAVFILAIYGPMGQDFKEGPNGKPGADIKSMEPDSPMPNSGFEVGDLILSVNGMVADSNEAWTSIHYGIREDVKTTITARRNDRDFEKQVKLNEVGREKYKTLDVHYQTITSDDGINQRVIITISKEA
ncbi:MAG: serine protease [Muricauda sp. TMED12]|nr:MAG: serine protease [Muricauda sp. TMED12]